jgi:hypothetical protein
VLCESDKGMKNLVLVFKLSNESPAWKVVAVRGTKARMLCRLGEFSSVVISYRMLVFFLVVSLIGIYTVICSIFSMLRIIIGLFLH